MARYTPLKPINLAFQKYHILQKWKNWNCKIDHTILHARGKLKPTEFSREYLISIKYKMHENPETHLIYPEMQNNFKDERPPHIYGWGKLCLFRPAAGEWDSSMLISDTIIPWASLWLYFYEIWLATGEWLGEGIHPRRKVNK